MKLSELIDRCHGSDPELVIEDEDGIPCPVRGVDHGVMATPGGPVTFVLLEPAHDEED